MDRARIIADDVVDRYVARRLSAEEEAQFEAYLVAHPEFADEIDLTNQMKLGLRTLQERGELDPLWRRNAGVRTPAFAIAASIVLVIVAATFIALWRTAPEAPLIAQSSTAFGTGDGAPAVAATYTLMRTRAQGVDLVIERPREPAIVQVRIFPENPGARGSFRIVLSHAVSTGTGSEEIATTDGVPVDAQGFLTIFVDAPRIEPGLYRVAVTRTGLSQETALSQERALSQETAGAGSFSVEVR
jgi:hypothetical protein